MKKNIRYNIVLLLLMVEAVLIPTFAQMPEIKQGQSISFEEYLNRVGKKNLSYLAEKLNVSIADAIRPAFFADAARPFSLSSSTAFSMLPSASVRAFLQSIMPAPVISLSSFTIPAVIAMFDSLLNNLMCVSFSVFCEKKLFRLI